MINEPLHPKRVDASPIQVCATGWLGMPSPKDSKREGESEQVAIKCIALSLRRVTVQRNELLLNVRSPLKFR